MMSRETMGSSLYDTQAGQLAVGGGPERGVDLLDGDVAVEERGQVAQRPVGDRYPEREPVEPAVELRDDDADGACRAGRGGNDVDRGGAGPVQVLVRAVQEVLIAGVAVNGGKEALA